MCCECKNEYKIEAFILKPTNGKLNLPQDFLPIWVTANFATYYPWTAITSVTGMTNVANAISSMVSANISLADEYIVSVKNKLAINQQVYENGAESYVNKIPVDMVVQEYLMPVQNAMNDVYVFIDSYLKRANTSDFCPSQTVSLDNSYYLYGVRLVRF